MKLIDMTGMRYGSLTVLYRDSDYISPQGVHYAMWHCKCDCGNEITANGNDIRRGHTKSCGCQQRKIAKEFNTTHGKKDTRLYNIWSNMKQRCLNKNHPRYNDYGGRGINICDEWVNDFQSFYDWAIANGYSEDLSIDRTDNNKGYSPDNCRWATIIEQNNNRRPKRTNG